ncbi:MAG: sigma 54-interacting transcriptional regulator, partial [Stenotrophobium sp.]
MFLKNSRKTTESSEIAQKLPPPYLLVITAETDASHRDGNDAIRNQVPESRRCDFLPLAARGEGALPNCEFVLSLFIDPAQLDGLADQVLAARRGGRATTLIVAVNGAQLVALGKWLDRRANEGKLAGMRLILADSVTDLAAQLGERLQQVREENVIRMPLNTEIENSPHRNFYVFSPELHALVARIRGFAQNGITRACLLGGPGSGKTSLAYYYFLVRERGRFVSVNLSAENTGDKAAVKSLLCGHVSGAFPGAAGRTGAFSHARDGVCFLDESHGVMGAVMEVLMEALDSG